MKKLLVVLLALTFVFAMATATFAVATTSVDGKVELTLDSVDQIEGAVDGEIHFDLAKDYGDGYKAGLVITADPNEANKVIFDGAGWIEITQDWGVITLKTDLNANAANELGGKCDMTSGPGGQVVTSALMEGLTLTGVVNEKAQLDGNDVQWNLYNIMLKAVYAADPLTLGFGYQTNGVITGADPAVNDAMAFWAGYQINEAMKAYLEYTSRPNVDADGASCLEAKFSYNAAPLTVTAAYYNKTTGFVMDDLDDLTPYYMFFAVGMEGGLLDADVTYQITDAISAYFNFEMAMVDGWEDDNMWFKLGVIDKLTDTITAEAYYASLVPDISKIDVKITDTLVPGVVASLELFSLTVNPLDPVNGYEAKITATL